MGEPVFGVGVNELNRKLMVQTPFELKRMEIAANPYKPVELNHLQFSSCKYYTHMHVEGPWTYFTGDGKKSVYDDGDGNLVKDGGHNLNAWIKGRVKTDDRAERGCPVINACRSSMNLVTLVVFFFIVLPFFVIA